MIVRMDALHTIRTLIARLAGAPPPVTPLQPVGRSSRHGSGLHDASSSESGVAGVRPRTSRQRDGDAGEIAARRHLERSGLHFVAANVWYRDGELDLVMREVSSDRRDATLVFVEVRRRARDSHGGALASITASKRRRIVAAAAHYLVALGTRVLPPCRFDVVTIEGDATHGFRISWHRDAFRADD